VNLWTRLQGLGRRLGSLVVEESTTTEIPPTGYATLFRDSSSGDLTMRLSDGTTVAAGGGGGGGAPSGAAGGDLGGTYPNPSVDKVAGVTPSAYVLTLLNDANASTARTTLGVAIGTDVQAWDTDLDGYAALSSTGLVARTGSGTAAARTLTAGSAQVTVTNGSGVSGNPTIDLAYASAVRETSGPTTLPMGAIPEGSYLKVSGGVVIGVYLALYLLNPGPYNALVATDSGTSFAGSTWA